MNKEQIKQHLKNYADVLDALMGFPQFRCTQLAQTAGKVRACAECLDEIIAHEIAGHYAKMRDTSEADLKKMADSVVDTLLDTERLDFVIEKKMSFQRSAEGIYVKEVGFFPTGREAIDAAMQREKEKAK